MGVQLGEVVHWLPRLAQVALAADAEGEESNIEVTIATGMAAKVGAKRRNFGVFMNFSATRLGFL